MHVDACGTHDLDAGAVVAGIGVERSDKDGPDARPDQSTSAGGRPADERTRLERHEHRQTVAVGVGTEGEEGGRFGVWRSGRSGIPARHHFAAAHDYTSDGRIRQAARQRHAALLERSRHELTLFLFAEGRSRLVAIDHTNRELYREAARRREESRDCALLAAGCSSVAG